MSSVVSTAHVKLNYKFQKKDIRDFKAVTSKGVIIDSFSLRSKVRFVYDQESIGSCVSNAFAQYINICTTNNVKISRLLHYYCGRAIEGDSSLDDSGLQIRQAAKIIQKYGACSETTWPYDVSKFNQLPPLNVFKSSLFFRKYTYSFVDQQLDTLRSVLYTKKKPIIFGINVYDSFLTDTVAKTGIVPMPNLDIEQLLGGHCIVMIGFDNIKSQFICVNSWGSSWGSKGFFYLPYDYVLNPSFASDFCCLDFVY